MKFSTFTQELSAPLYVWFAAVLLGVIAPTSAMVWLTQSHPYEAPAGLVAPILALGMMSAGMIGAAAARSLRLGMILALLNGFFLLLLAYILGRSSLLDVVPVAVAMAIASVSFAARGALFARSSGEKGWLIAVFVVAGEAAILIAASIDPSAIPDWLLVLLPAQWANMAFNSALTGREILAFFPSVLALGGTALATMLVTKLWPRRWPYLVMFTTWLSLSALVWHWQPPF